MTDSETDDALIRRAQHDRTAFGDLYERYRDRLYAYILFRTGSPPDAEDLTQRVFSHALTALDSFHPEGGSVRGWLYTIAHNLLANHYRMRARRPSAPLEAAEGAIDPAMPLEGLVEAQEDAEEVRRAIERLSPERQHLLLLKYASGLSNAEISRVLDKREGAVKSLIWRTLGALRREIDAGRATNTAL